ncbi:MULTISPECIES: UDP-glucose 4-epimerase GalE [Citrobacter]|uniref:UDP-glucose 4-epimerase GalE n=1 Tax=Citrobacter TaxID=544 RepID=UPI0015EA217F|nr:MULTISPECIES: UDP-glucose 4-epimerase GalE [unclassified Citrobacter]MDM3403657.1 UDP-glucose 4-epimerase GalE [Citrobacter sp. Cb019]MDM3427159.1 UDP-glucose 4-epimerase GalE [Citrobacter sp. Cb026]QMD06083.1 UDP-glucose 4-epimerase GalE [Citrobacter sp. RHB36-C18]
MSILVTGGCGYIGSHTVLTLLESNYDVIVVDNLSNSSDLSLKRIAKITGRNAKFYKGDVCDGDFLGNVFKNHEIEAVIHFAALKSVGESVKFPIDYYNNNMLSLLVLLDVMKENKVNNLIFSSSATIYGLPKEIPLRETTPVGESTNPYGSTKLFGEIVLQDVVKANKYFNITSLRYFNPVGAHFSGEIGESPSGIPNNLVPYLTQVAIGNLPSLNIFGNDYPTPDGTGVRDYIHVVDLAEGHLAALKKINSQSGYRVYNLGTGKGYSVLELIKTFEEVTGIAIQYKIQDRRVGDIAECWSDPDLAAQELKWRAKRDLRAMLSDSWRWQSNYPLGYVD